MSHIIEHVRALMESGSEAELRAFVVEHFDELPIELQEELAPEIIQEALQEAVREQEAIVALKEEAVEMIDELEKRD